MAVAQGRSQPETAPYLRLEDIDLTPLIIPRLQERQNRVQEQQNRVRQTKVRKSRLLKACCLGCFVVGVATGAGGGELIRGIAGWRSRSPARKTAAAPAAAAAEKPIVEVRTLSR
jgi:hypothetical protein